jgi:hypothetical protein
MVQPDFRRTFKLSGSLTRTKPLKRAKPPIACAVCCSTWFASEIYDVLFFLAKM